MFRLTTSRSLAVALLLAVATLGAVEQVAPPFDFLQLIEDSHAVMQLDNGFAPQGSYARVQLIERMRGDVWSTRLDIADSLTTGLLELRHDPDLRQAETTLDTPNLLLRLVSRDWAQRPGMDGGQGELGFRWSDELWRVRLDAAHRQTFDHSMGGGRVERRLGRLALAAEFHGVSNPHDRWLAGGDVTLPLGDFLVQSGVQLDDREEAYPHVRLQWLHGASLLASASWSAELDSPPFDSLFTADMLSWRMARPGDETLDTRTRVRADLRLEWAVGDWRGDVWSRATRVDTTLAWGWAGDSLEWRMAEDDEWRARYGAGVRWRIFALDGERTDGDLQEFDARWRWSAAARFRFAPWLFARLRGEGVVDQMMQGKERTFWTSSAAVEYSGPYRLSLQAGASRQWRDPLPGESDRRWGCWLQLTYRQGDNARFD